MKDIAGNTWRLEDLRGQRILLSFYRYASCPLCNLRVHQLLQHVPRWSERGLLMLGVFESNTDQMTRYLDRHSAPFPLLPDPRRELYRRYAVNPSWGGLFRAFTHHLPQVFDAVARKGFLPGRMEGAWAMLPADFLIDSDLRFHTAFYGSHIGDHLPIERIDDFLNS